MRMIFCGLLLLSAAVFAGNIYRWVDAQGQVHYGETPPQGSPAQAQGKLHVGAGAAAPSAPVLPAASSPAVASAEDSARAKAVKETKAKNCQAAKAQIEMLETKTARRILLTQKDGSVSRMTDEEFEKSMADAKKAAASNCS